MSLFCEEKCTFNPVLADYITSRKPWQRYCVIPKLLLPCLLWNEPVFSRHLYTREDGSGLLNVNICKGGSRSFSGGVEVNQEKMIMVSWVNKFQRRIQIKKKASFQGRGVRIPCHPPPPLGSPLFMRQVWVVKFCDDIKFLVLLIDDLGYDGLGSDVANDFDYYKDAIESRAGN